MLLLTCVYNTLKRKFRGIDMATGWLTVSMTALVLGFGILTWNKDGAEIWKIFGAIIIGIAIIMWIWSLQMLKDEQKDQKKERRYLTTLIEAIAKKMGVDVSKLNGGKR